MDISTNTLILAIKAVDRHIKDREKALREGAAEDDSADESGQHVLDLMQALSELASAYEQARRRQPHLPPLTEWLEA
jgi:hypothetical protein